MIVIVLLFSLGHTIERYSVAERVDMIELNHFYSDEGEKLFSQILFLEWAPDYSRFHVMSWVLLENGRSRPRYDANSKMYVFEMKDGEFTRIVQSRLFRETWSQVDPERENKTVMPEKLRTELLPK